MAEAHLRELDSILECFNRYQFPNEKWPELGVELGFSDTTLLDIDNKFAHISANSCLRECLKRWLSKQDDRAGADKIRSKLAKALDQIGKSTIAQKIIGALTVTELSEFSMTVPGSGYESYMYMYPHSETSTESNGTGELVTGKELYTFDERTNADDYIDNILLDIDISRTIKDPHNITMDSFKEMILNDRVAVTTSLIVTTGLPKSGKSQLLTKLFNDNIQLKSTAKSMQNYMERKQDERGLSVYELCIMGRKGRSAWSFATKRYGAIFSVLSDIIRQAGGKFRDLNIALPDESSNHTVLDQLYYWLLVKVKNILDTMNSNNEDIKLSLLHDGISLVNIMDVGVNKALYDFMPILLVCSHSYVRYVTFSLEKDGSALYDKPDMSDYQERFDDKQIMKRRSRVTYLLRFASIGNQHNCRTIMAATTHGKSCKEWSTAFSRCKETILTQAKAQKIDDLLNDWQCIDLESDKSIKEVKQNIEQSISCTYDRQIDMPLKWIILRSLIVSLKENEHEVIILKKHVIEQKAEQLNMNADDVKKFLKAFTDFGSILYIPLFEALKDIVIVDVWEFVKCLNELFYDLNKKYPDLRKYGFISQTSTKALLGNDEEDFMQVLITLSMTARVQSGKNILIDGKCGPNEMCYYLPSARVKESCTPKDDKNDFAFLEIQSVNFPANVQACIAGNVMNSNNAVLVLCEENNITRFQFEYPDCPAVQVEMMYLGSRTRLRVTNCNNTNDILSSEAAVDACTIVLNSCCKCLNGKKKIIPDLIFSVGIQCCGSADIIHYLYCDDISNICYKCSESKPENLFHQCWIKAALKCIGLNKTDKIKLEEALPLEPEDISQVAKDIVAKENFNQETLADALRITQQEKESLQGYEKSRCVMLMLMMWEKRNECKATKALLANILKDLNYKDIATRLDPPTLAY